MNGPDERLRATGSPIERDGTASDWDTEVASLNPPDIPGTRIALASLLIGMALSGLVALMISLGWIDL